MEVPRALLDRGAPRPEKAVRRYRARAARYDAWTAAGQAYRDATVRRLELTPGAVVLDTGCGTGLNFAALEHQIGPGGRVIGIDLSPEMLAEAHARTERHDWANVTLIESAIKDATLPVTADAALLCGVTSCSALVQRSWAIVCVCCGLWVPVASGVAAARGGWWRVGMMGIAGR